jgi:Tol biopolymer transport system component
VTIDETQERAWWPEWCDGNRTLLFEGGDKQSDKSQTIYSVAYESGQAAIPSKITWSGFPMLGVPRCANRISKVSTSARMSLESESWQLHYFDLRRPNDHSPVGDGFLPFGGYVSYSGDDSWLALMHKDNDTDPFYRILQIQWSDPQRTIDMPLDPRVYSAMYPSISPITGQIAYACELEPETRREPGSWGLCLQDANGQDFRILESVGLTTGLREGYNRFHVFTPRWSSDGRWIAYASPKDGDWDVYLYLLEQGIEFNLTQSLTGDQFQPSWSKP